MTLRYLRRIRPTGRKKDIETPWVQVIKKGLFVDLGGELIELFRIGVLADALDRHPVQIKVWERQKLFPPPLFDVEVKKHATQERKQRWYSSVQIANCHFVMQKKYGGRKNLTGPGEMDCFLADLRAVFYLRFTLSELPPNE